MNDATYKRRMLIEDYLGVELTRELISNDEYYNLSKRVLESVMAGDDSYQLVFTHSFAGVSDLAVGNALLDWRDLDHVNLSADYWNQSVNKDLELNGHQFYAVSDFLVPMPTVIFFNKGLVADNSLENPYDLVRSGKWTLAKLTEMSEAVTADLNGDTKFDGNDRYGIGCSDNREWNSFLYSAGIRLVDTRRTTGTDSYACRLR